MRKNQIIVAVFLIWIFGLFITMIVLPDQKFSELENRILSEMPKISAKSFFSGEYGTDFEKYLNDQFPFRDLFKQTSATYQYATGKREIGGAIVGDKGLYLPTRMNDRTLLDKNIKAIQDIKKVFPNVYVGLIPSSGYLYGDDLPERIPFLDEGSVIDEVYDAVQEEGCIDLYGTLEKEKDQNLYYATDHHWNSLGAYYGYTAIADAMGLEPIQLEEKDQVSITDSFYGTLYSKAPLVQLNPEEIFTYVSDLDTKVTTFDGMDYKEGSLYNEDKLSTKDKYAYFLGGNQPLVILETKEVEKDRLLIIRDSFSDSLAPYLQTHFSEIHLMDVRYYRKSIQEYIKEHDIDEILILQNVNQFINVMDIGQISYMEDLDTLESADGDEMVQADHSDQMGQIYNSDLYGNILGEEFYFHRNLLNETEQIAYDELYTGMSQCVQSIDLDVAITETQLCTIRDAIINDHPELIWIGIMFKYWVDEQGFVLNVEETYSEISQNYTDFHNQALAICSNAIKFDHKADQVKYIHDYLCDFNTYDVDAPNNQVAYGAIVEGKTVCAGYARAFQYCMQLLGIPSTVVYGETSEVHSWNLVQLDGEYYNVDVTWDDGKANAGEHCYDYFNVTDEEISGSHTRKNLSVSLPEAKGTLYKYGGTYFKGKAYDAFEKLGVLPNYKGAIFQDQDGHLCMIEIFDNSGSVVLNFHTYMDENIITDTITASNYPVIRWNDKTKLLFVGDLSGPEYNHSVYQLKDGKLENVLSGSLYCGVVENQKKSATGTLTIQGETVCDVVDEIIGIEEKSSYEMLLDDYLEKIGFAKNEIYSSDSIIPSYESYWSTTISEMYEKFDGNEI